MNDLPLECADWSASKGAFSARSSKKGPRLGKFDGDKLRANLVGPTCWSAWTRSSASLPRTP